MSRQVLEKNPIKPEDSIVLAGKDYKLKFEFDAVADAEDETGKVLILSLSTKPTVSTVRAILFALLKPHSPQITFEEVKALVTLHNALDIWVKCAGVWSAAFAQPKEAEEGTEKN